MKATIVVRALAVLIGVGIGFGAAVWLVLLVSLRSSVVRVPDVHALDASRAVVVLQSRGLVARVQEGVFDPQLPPGRVARQRPSPGFELKRGGQVLLYPSLGEAAVRVKDLSGLPVSVAEMELERAQLHPGRSCEVQGQADAVVVVAQSPAAAVLVPPDSEVAMLVNRSPRTRRYVMPDLVGLSEAQATTAIRRLGFHLATVQSVTYPGIAPGVVLRQDPPAGGPVHEAAVTGLWVSR